MTVNHIVITTTNNNKASEKRQKSSLERLYQTRFHEAALWGAITFVRMFTGSDKMGREIILAYQKYFGLNEDTFPADSAYVQFSRVNKKIKEARKTTDAQPVMYKGQMMQELREMKNQLDEIIKMMEDGKG